VRPTEPGSLTAAGLHFPRGRKGKKLRKSSGGKTETGTTGDSDDLKEKLRMFPRPRGGEKNGKKFFGGKKKDSRPPNHHVTKPDRVSHGKGPVSGKEGNAERTPFTAKRGEKN